MLEGKEASVAAAIIGVINSKNAFIEGNVLNMSWATIVNGIFTVIWM